MLTNPVLDPFGKIRSSSIARWKVSNGGPEPERMSFGGGAPLPDQQQGAC